MRDLTAKTKSALAWLSISHSLRVVFQIGVILVLSRILGPTPFGVVAAATAIILVAQTLAPLGLAAALVAVPGADGRQVRAASTVGLACAVVLSLLIGLSAGEIERRMGIEGVALALLLLLPVVLTAPLKQICLRSMQKQMAYRTVAVADVFIYLVLYGGLSVVLSLQGWGFRGLIIAQVVSELASTLLMVAASRAPIGLTLNWRGLRPMVAYGLGVTAANAAEAAADSLPKLFAGNALGAAALGCYSRAWDLTRRVNTAMDEVSSKVLFPAFALRQHDVGVLGDLYRRYMPIALAVLIPVGVILAAARHEVVVIVLGRGWELAAAPFGVLALLIPIQSSRKIALTMVNSLGRSWRNSAVNLATCAVLLLALPFAVRFGVAGVAGAILLAGAVSAALAQASAVHALSLRADAVLTALAPPLLTGVMVAVGCGFALLTLQEAAVSGPLLRLVAITAGGALAGGLAMLALPAVFAPAELRDLSARWLAAARARMSAQGADRPQRGPG